MAEILIVNFDGGDSGRLRGWVFAREKKKIQPHVWHQLKMSFNKNAIYIIELISRVIVHETCQFSDVVMTHMYIGTSPCLLSLILENHNNNKINLKCNKFIFISHKLKYRNH